MDLVSRFFKKSDSAGTFSYEASFTLGKTALEQWLFDITKDIENKVAKRLEDYMFDQLKNKVVGDKLLTQKVINEIRLLVAKRLVEKEEK